MGTWEGIIPPPGNQGGSPEEVIAELRMRSVKDAGRGGSEPFRGSPSPHTSTANSYSSCRS